MENTSIQVFALAMELNVSILELQDAQDLLGVRESVRSDAWISAHDAEILRKGFRDWTWGRGSEAVGTPLDQDARRSRVEKSRRDIAADRRRSS